VECAQRVRVDCVAASRLLRPAGCSFLAVYLCSRQSRRFYRARWEIEVFFKQVKQTLRRSGFVGYSANAIRWQVWTALLVYVLLRFAAHLSAWGHSFTRIFAVVRAAMWERLDVLLLITKLWDSRRKL